jgi:thiol-disulfide isomerase/thioredoxin
VSLAEEVEDAETEGATEAVVAGPHEGVTVLTEKSADIVLLGGQKNVFLMVSADWCPKCRGLKEVFAQVAAALKETPIVLALVDGTHYRPPGFTEEQGKGFPRLRMFRPQDPTPTGIEQDEANIYRGRTLSAASLITFIHERSEGSFDLQAALTRSEALDEGTKAVLQGQIRAAILADEKSSVHFELTAMGPCASVMREAFTLWRMQDYFEPPKGDDSMERVQRCLASQDNEDFWLQVTDVALDQIRVCDKSQKKFEARDSKGDTDAKPSKGKPVE